MLVKMEDNIHKPELNNSAESNFEIIETISLENDKSMESSLEDYIYESDLNILRGWDKIAIIKLLLKKKSKRCTAEFLKNDCLSNKNLLTQEVYPKIVLTDLLDIFLNPVVNMCADNTVLWLQYLIASGKETKDFYKEVEEYDNPTTCSLVWTADFMAYRCRTCGLSPCMSLCLECFHNGDHSGHDYNMFKSQAGGACDCGNRAVMQSSGFCNKHNGSKKVIKTKPPEDMLLVAQIVLPRLFQRFILFCRKHGDSDISTVQRAMREAEPFIEFLQELCCCGAPMRSLMSEVFCNSQIYKFYSEARTDYRYNETMIASEVLYKEALQSIDVGKAPEGFEDILSFHGPLVHTSFIEELVFWMVKFEFPQKLVCLLLNMRPDVKYEDAFARAFVQHYSRIAIKLVQSHDPDTLSHRVVHVSVQLFSDNSLAFRMTHSYHLLHVMILSLKKMMAGICEPSTLHDQKYNRHMVVDCAHRVMKKHCFWPLVSDLNNILSFKNIGEALMSEQRLLHEWISFLQLFQGMNNNVRQLLKHVDYEPQTYYSAFSAEIEASACPLWALLSHLKDSSSSHHSVAILKECLVVLGGWFNEIGFGQLERVHYEEVSFHLPLHRNYSLVLRQAIKKQGVKLKDVLPSSSMLSMMLVHPMRIQVAFHEISNDLWARNGLQIKGQAMTYIQCHFCCSLVDPDLFLIQVGAGEMLKDTFLLSIFERFHALDELTFTRDSNDLPGSLPENKFSLALDSTLFFLANITTNRHSLGLSEKEIVKKEMMSLICLCERTHSQIMEHIPEKCLQCAGINFEEILSEVTKYCQPECAKSGAMKQGIYVPQPHVWEELFDPIFVQLRTLHKKEFQNGLTRFRQYVKDSNKFDRRECSRLWPPYRLPTPVNSSFVDPRRILACRTFHAIIFVLLYKCLASPSVNEHILSLTIFLLELTIDYQFSTTDEDNNKQVASPSAAAFDDDSRMERPDGLFYLWYSSDDVFENATTRIDKVQLKSPINIRTESDGVGDDFEMVEIEGCEPMLSINDTTTQSVRSLVSGSELVPYSEEASAIVPTEQTREHSDNLSREVEMMPAGHYPYLPVLAGSEMVVRQSREVLEQFSTLYNTQSRRLTGPSELYGPTGDGEADSSVMQYLADSSSNTKALVESSTVDESSQALDLSKYSITTPMDSSDQYVKMEESLISLLLKLHTMLTGKRGSYTPNFDPEEHDSRIGDGPFFVAKVLNKMGRMSSCARASILSNQRLLYPEVTQLNRVSSDDDDLIGGDRKSKADDSRRRAMAFFKKERTQFLRREKMRKLEKGSHSSAPSSDVEDLPMEEDDQDTLYDSTVKGAHLSPQPVIVESTGERLYECVICSTKNITSKKNSLIGYVALLTPTNVVGHRLQSPTGHALPLCESDFLDLPYKRKPLGKYMENQWKHIDKNCDPNISFNILDKGWNEGVHVQVCGHTVHIMCLQTYILSIWDDPSRRASQIPANRTDFQCPLCRKSSNALIPIAPYVENPMEEEHADPVADIDRELANPVVPDLGYYYDVKVDDLITILAVPTPFNFEECISSPIAFQFFSSVLRINIENMLNLYGGSLVNYEERAVSQKRSAIVPLKCCLSHETKSLLARRDIDVGGTHWIRELWSSLTERPIMDFKGALVTRDTQIPMLFRDPVTLLLHLIIFTRVEYYPDFLDCIVRHVYRLVVIRATASLLFPLSENRRLLMTTEGPLAPLFAMVSNHLRDCANNLREASSRVKDQPSYEKYSVNELTCEVREQCLSFLRIASLLKSQLNEERLPTIVDPLAEPGALERYLGVWETCSVVNTSAMGKMCGSLVPSDSVPLPGMSSSTVMSPCGVPVETHLGDLSGVCKMWCAHLSNSAFNTPSITVLLMLNRRFYQPKLLALPNSYEELFQFYHTKKCSQCGNVPRDVAVCLVCGDCVCLKRPCSTSRRDVFFGSAKHAKECGNGTSVFLSVTQSCIYVIRGSRLGLWGCIHLDSFGEEDRDLKRGKPLFLSTRRYNLLEQQWIQHAFDHTLRKWCYPNED